jgi:hypothetical protein
LQNAVPGSAKALSDADREASSVAEVQLLNGHVRVWLQLLGAALEEGDHRARVGLGDDPITLL